ncbi:MAG: aldehyde dehydrogenase family protein, partial [Pseudodonghicola sp.]
MTTQLLIANEHRPASDGRSYTRKDPVSGQVASTAAAASVEDALAAVQAADAAFASWAATAPQTRRALLLKAADAMEARKDDFIAAAMAETG